MAVFVLDRHKKPLMPCSEKRARKLLARGRARVHRLMPFSIRLVDRTVNESVLQTGVTSRARGSASGLEEGWAPCPVGPGTGRLLLPN